MMVLADASYYFHRVVAVTEEYLGPASERFIRRQSEFHLGKPAESITKQDIPKLAYGVGIALGLLVNDAETVRKAVHQIEKIK